MEISTQLQDQKISQSVQGVAGNLLRHGLVLVAFVLPLFGLGRLVFGQDLPAYRGHVNDFANVIGIEDAQHMENLLRQVRERTGIEIAVATVPSLGDRSIEEYSLALARQWGIGDKKSNTGLLLLVAPNDRKYRFEVGYGLEGDLPDSLVGEIGRRMVPFFKAQRYGAGITRGVDILAATIAQARHVEIEGAQKSLAFQNRHRKSRGVGALIFGAFFIIFIVVAIAASRAARRGGLKGRYRRHSGSDWIWYPIIFGGGGPGGFGGSSGGGSSLGDSGGGGGGGFGGFGGGSFGGGGASGDW